MGNVKVLDKAQEKKLFDAMTGAIKQANAGEDPNVAIAKQAVENGFSPEFAGRMVETYNTSKTLNHISSTTGEKRAETFTLANTEEVIKHMYAADASLQKVAELRSDVFKDFSAVDEMRLPVLEKAAFFNEQTNTAGYESTNGDLNYNRTLRKAINKVAELKTAKSDVEAHLFNANTDLQLAMFKASEAFKHTQARPFEEVERAAIYKYGSDATKALDLLWRTKDFELMGEKRGSLNDGDVGIFGTSPSDKAIDTFVGAVIETAKITKMAEEAIGGIDESIKNLEGLMAKIAGISTSPIGILPEMVSGEAPSTPDLVDPEHEANIRAIKVKMMINDMMTNDPVLSGYAPADVLSTYNELATAFPAMSTNPLVMRQAISRSIQQRGHFDPAEVGTLLRNEQSQRSVNVIGD